MRTQTILLAVGLALAGAARAGDTSEATFAYVEPSFSSFWHTAMSRTLTLPIDWPDGAKSATLAVRGSTHRADYAVTGASFTLTLPEASRRADEDVYELTLAFDDGTTRTARLGVVTGVRDGAEGTTRCSFDASTARWRKASTHGVLPVPAGTTAFTVNGETVRDGDTGFTGAQGWYALPNLAIGASADVSLTADGATRSAPLTVHGDGLAVIVQ